LSSTGSTDSQRLRLTLTIRVESVDFDTQAVAVRVNGQVCQENQHVKMGAYHTIDLELHRPFTIVKTEWDMVALERVQLACDVTQRADIAAIVLQEGTSWYPYHRLNRM
jgi:protein pelota